MHIVETLADIHALARKGAVTPAMAAHLERELHLLRDSLEPEVPMELFSLSVHGPIVLLRPGEENLAGLGMRGNVRDLAVEWVSRRRIGGAEWYVIFVLADNDYMLQIYVPRDGLSPDFAEYLAELAEDDEQSDGRLPEGQPF